MSERADLTCFIPEDQRETMLQLREELAPVVNRIGQVLSPDKVWELFSSTPKCNRGVICFPYCRVDMAVVVCRDMVSLLTNYGNKVEPEKCVEWYELASRLALKALLWVEIGFQGLETLAKSPASRNWTVGVGHFVNDEERAKRIMTEGAKLYRDSLGKFVDFRTRQGITSDCFDEYKVGHLLDQFRATG